MFRCSILFFIIFFSFGELRSDEIKKIKKYLNNISSLKSDFTQITGDGSITYGTIFMKKPNKFRIVFHKPQNEILVSDGKKIALINKKINTISMYSIDQIPFNFLLTEYISFENYIISETINKNNILSFEVSEKKQKGKKIKLIFENKPLNLRKWEIEDQQGNLIQISLNNLSTNITLENRKFLIVDPRKNPFSKKE